jgi:PAS domain S-box-containing protein
VVRPVFDVNENRSSLPLLAADAAPAGDVLSARHYTSAFLLALGLLVLSAVAALWNTVGLSQTRGLVERSYQVRSALESVHTYLNQAESARRGSAFAAPATNRRLFEDAKTHLAGGLARLDQLVTVPEQRERLERLRKLIQKRMRPLQHSMDAPASIDSARRAEITEEGSSIMDGIREVIAEMRVATDGIRQAHQAAERSVQRWATWVSSASLLAAFGILSMGFVWITRLVRSREEALRSLRDSETDFRASFEVATVGKAQIDAATGYFLRVNQTFCDITGYERAELLRMRVPNLIHPDDRARDRERLEPFLRGTAPRYEAEKRYLRKNGSVIWVSMSAAMIQDGEGRPLHSIATITDVTMRRRAEEALHERALVASVKAEVASALGRGEALSDLLRRALGCIVERLEVASIHVWSLDATSSLLDLQVMVGLRPEGIAPPPRIPVGDRLIGRVAATRRAYMTNSLPQDPGLRDGAWVEREHLVAFAGYPLLIAGELLGVLAVFARQPLPDYALDAFRDIAEEIARAVQHERLDVERAHLLRQTQQAHQHAEAASRAKDDFLSILSHELRTPLNAVLGWTELLRMGAVEGADVDEALATIEQNALRQSQLISDILDISRVVEGRLKLETERSQLGEIVEAAVDTVRHAAVAKSIALEVTLGATPAIVVDATRIQQVLWNLLSNAIKFTPKGGAVRVELHDGGSHAVMVVTDSGRGISAEFLPHIFERFTQEDASSTRSQAGLGLGMAIVRQLLELHGGSVSAASPGLGAGATFTVRLPYSPSTAVASADLLRTTPDEVLVTPGSKPLHDLRVLVVDDERDTLSAVERALGFFGASVITATSAADALRKLAENPPDVLVSDVAMPGEDGYSLIEKVRSRRPEEGGRVPAVALTAFAGAEDRRRLLAAGFQLHLPKPVEPIRLATAISQLVH